MLRAITGLSLSLFAIWGTPSWAATPRLTAAEWSVVDQVLAERARFTELKPYLESQKGQMNEGIRQFLLKRQEGRKVPMVPMRRDKAGTIWIQAGRSTELPIEIVSLKGGRFRVNSTDFHYAASRTPSEMIRELVQTLPSRVSRAHWDWIIPAAEADWDEDFFHFANDVASNVMGAVDKMTGAAAAREQETWCKDVNTTIGNAKDMTKQLQSCWTQAQIDGVKKNYNWIADQLLRLQSGKNVEYQSGKCNDKPAKDAYNAMLAAEADMENQMKYAVGVSPTNCENLSNSAPQICGPVRIWIPPQGDKEGTYVDAVTTGDHMIALKNCGFEVGKGVNEAGNYCTCDLTIPGKSISGRYAVFPEKDDPRQVFHCRNVTNDGSSPDSAPKNNDKPADGGPAATEAK